jgi:hypothetical protein
MHRIAAGREDGLPHAAAERSDNFGGAAADPNVHREGAEAEIEQDGLTILGAQCFAIRAYFSKLRAAGARVLGQAQGDALAPAFLGQRFRRNRTQRGRRGDAQAAALSRHSLSRGSDEGPSVRRRRG